MIIAIDGPAGAGKSTVARMLADQLSMGYLDTGAMYRAVALLALTHGVDCEDQAALVAGLAAHTLDFHPRPGGIVITMDGREVDQQIRSTEVTAHVSLVAAHPEIREIITGAQRRVLGGGSWVCDGRDIGTTVCPSAELKVFLSASARERARRRCVELNAAGVAANIDEVRAAIEQRDHLDITRNASPLRAADDARHLDTSDQPINEVVATIAGWAREVGV